MHIFLTVIPVFNLPLQKENTKLWSALGQWHNWANIDWFDLQRKKSTMTWAKSCLIIRHVIGYDPFLLPPSSGLCFHLQKLPKETKHAYIYIYMRGACEYYTTILNVGFSFSMDREYEMHFMYTVKCMCLLN